MSRLAPLPRAFYERPTEIVARALIGKVIVRRLDGALRRARVVEVEAYLGEKDAASHARHGRTPRAAMMFGPPGHLYVYFVYGMHHCMNVVTETDGVAGAVLIRAAEPLPDDGGFPYRGPGKLCAGLGVTLADKGLDVTSRGAIYVADDGTPAPRLSVSKRVGVDYAGRWAARRLRFYVAGNPHVSGRPR
ncbi:MAG TPA: DNA-3-methyladenine glycosylase [Polyangia bacterium]|nr:DNA-3-methyladenine glycosylase [Polyangia bacterium]